MHWFLFIQKEMEVSKEKKPQRDGRKRLEASTRFSKRLLAFFLEKHRETCKRPGCILSISSIFMTTAPCAQER
jgi:hypothetical protein